MSHPTADTEDIIVEDDNDDQWMDIEESHVDNSNSRMDLEESGNGQNGQRKPFWYVVFVTVASVVTTGAGTGVGVYYATRDTGGSGATVLGFNLERDNADILSMHISARIGQWSKVWPILDKKPYLINVIPEYESTAILHKAAVYYNPHGSPVAKIIRYPSCDVLIKSTAYNRLPGLTAYDLAKQKADNTRLVHHSYYKNIADLLHTHSVQEINRRFSADIPFFVTQRKGEAYNKKGLPLILLSLSAYKKAFIEPDTRKLSPKTGFQDLLKLVLNSATMTWIQAQKQIISSLYGFDIAAATTIANGGTTEDSFYNNILWLYTSDHVYQAVNLALRRQANLMNDVYRTYKPLGDDILLGPYILMLDAILTYWSELQVYYGETYRGIGTNVTDQYEANSKIVFLTFISSSSDRAQAEIFRGNGTLFVIDNSMKTPWQPRIIDKYSKFDEKEKLYPPGAEFVVTRVFSRWNEVHLKLIHPEY